MRTMFRVSKASGICERLIKEVRPRTLTFYRPNKLTNTFEAQVEYRKTRRHIWCTNLADAELVVAHWESVS